MFVNFQGLSWPCTNIHMEGHITGAHHTEGHITGAHYTEGHITGAHYTLK